MPSPCPILRVPGRAAKIKALIAMHAVGWKWHDTIQVSLTYLAKWSDEREASTTHMVIGGMSSSGSIRAIHWQTAPGLQQLLDRPTQYTTVNSLSHLRAYALKHRPKVNPAPVAPPAEVEIPF